MKFNVSECDVLYIWRALLWGYSTFRGAGSRCFLQVLKMVVLFNSLLSSSNSYIKHFCFHKKYVQLRWKTWSCSFSGPPKGKRFLFLQENIFFYKSLTTCYFSPKFPVRKIPAHQLFPWPREGTSCAAASPCGCSLSRNVGTWWPLSRGDVLLWKARVCFGTLGRDRLFGAQFAVTSGCGIEGYG